MPKKNGNDYSVLDSTVVNQNFSTTDGMKFTPTSTEYEILKDGHLQVSSSGDLTVNKDVYKRMKLHQSDYTYREASDDYSCTVHIELLV